MRPEPIKSHRPAFYVRMSTSEQNATSLNRQLAAMKAVAEERPQRPFHVVHYIRISRASQ